MMPSTPAQWIVSLSLAILAASCSPPRESSGASDGALEMDACVRFEVEPLQSTQSRGNAGVAREWSANDDRDSIEIVLMRTYPSTADLIIEALVRSVDTLDARTADTTTHAISIRRIPLSARVGSDLIYVQPSQIDGVLELPATQMWVALQASVVSSGQVLCRRRIEILSAF